MSTHEIGDRPFPSVLHVKRDGRAEGAWNPTWNEIHEIEVVLDD